VPRGADVKVNVKPRMKSDVNGAVSGETIALFIDHTAAANDATGTGSVRARGVVSSHNLAANDGDTTAEGEIFIGRSSANSTNFRVTGSFNQTVLSKFASITNGGAATGVVPNGVNDIGAFTFAAAPNNNSKDGLNKIFIADLILTVQATNVEMSGDGFRLYNKAVGSATSVTCSPYSTSGVALSGTVSGAFHLWCPDLEYGLMDSTVDPASSDTLVLLANVTNANTAAAQGGNSILQISLNDFTNPTKIGVAPTRSHIEWRDMDNSSSQTFYWVEYPDTVVNSTTYHG
ncbi:MAG: hypothetical protein PHS73_04405, partial [Candidatus Peribacteraceae bacterium]|nr:hypothetical protein [Candidatus Peribacteraceae bacterium]